MTPRQIRASKNTPHPAGTVVGVTRGGHPVAVADGKGGVVYFPGAGPVRCDANGHGRGA